MKMASAAQAAVSFARPKRHLRAWAPSTVELSFLAAVVCSLTAVEDNT